MNMRLAVLLNFLTLVFAAHAHAVDMPAETVAQIMQNFESERPVARAVVENLNNEDCEIFEPKSTCLKVIKHRQEILYDILNMTFSVIGDDTKGDQIQILRGDQRSLAVLIDGPHTRAAVDARAIPVKEAMRTLDWTHRSVVFQMIILAATRYDIKDEHGHATGMLDNVRLSKGYEATARK